MGAGGGSDDGQRRILRLAPDCDPTTLSLSAEEGFLLSRIDGHTPWRLLREIGGMEAEEADLCLEGWLASGLVCVHGMGPDPKSQRGPNGARRQPFRAPRASTTHTPGEIDESLLDAGLDIDVEVQRRILSFESLLDQPYHLLLGVAPDADPKQVKRAYFGLSKEFHPDRFFRREIGGYVARLERIFKKVLEGYEILSDPELRAEVAKSTQSGAAAFEAPTGAGAPASGASSAAARPVSKLERLRQRMPFRIPERLVAERREKAAEFFRAAGQSERMGQLVEAASSVRIAICFDPFNSGYRSALVDLQAKVAEKKASELLEQSASDEMDEGQLKRAYKLLEDVLLYRPHDPALNHRAAAVALMLGDLSRAHEYATTAVEHCPEVASYHTTLGMVYREMGDPGHAKKEFETAIGLDADDGQARKALASLRLLRRTTMQGG